MVTICGSICQDFSRKKSCKRKTPLGKEPVRNQGGKPPLTYIARISSTLPVVSCGVEGADAAEETVQGRKPSTTGSVSLCR